MIWLRVLVAVLAGALVSVLVAPWGLYALHWFAYLPLFWALREESPRANRWLVLLYGTVAEALIFSWIAETITLFSNLPGPVAWAVLGLFAVVFGSPYFFTFTLLHPMRKRLGDLWIVALPAWLVVVEWVASIVILFPYQQGVSQYRSGAIWQLASVTGVWGLSFLVLFFNAAFGEWIYRRREGRGAPVRWMAAAVVALLAVVAFGTWRHAAVEAQLAQAPIKRVLQIQSGHDMIWRMSHRSSESFQEWVDGTAALQPGEVDLVVWPEGAVPYQLNASTAVGLLWDMTERGDFDLVVGAGTRERDADESMGEAGRVRIFNSTYLFARDHRAVPDTVPDVRATFEALTQAGCDLAAAHVVTPMEARALATVGQAMGTDAACVASLQAHAEALQPGFKARTSFEQTMLEAGTWEAFRHHSARLGPEVRERMYDERRGVATWMIEPASCTDGDCLFVMVRCLQDDTCSVVPEAPHYDKMVPLPFGEYLPLAETFPWLADLIEGPGNFRAGTEAVVFEADGTRLATPICYEAILGYVCDDFERPDLFVNVTNDAWFGNGAASDLHGMLAAIRAIELGVPVFRSAYAGVSFVAEPHGDLLYETPLYTAVARPVQVRLAVVDTVYKRLGDWFVWLCGLLLAGLWWRTRGATVA